MSLVIRVPVGEGAVMTIVDPRSFDAGGVEWCLRYGRPEAVALVAAELVSTVDYLLSQHISMKEATRRLRLMRQARKAANHEGHK